MFETKPFNLEEYLANPSSKVVTRDGRQVRIICTDRKARAGNIVGLIGEDESLIYVWNNDGKHIVSEIPDNDLFFADEEEKLTEFEKQLGVYIYFPKLSCEFDEEEKKYIRDAANTLFNLARKELQPEFDKDMDKLLEETDKIVERRGYERGREDALKDLPKWKKDINNLSSLTYRLDNRGNGNILLCRKGYVINIKELLNLPKEE